MTDGTQSSGVAGGEYDPWAPPERRMSLEKSPQPGQDPAPAAAQPPSVHDQAPMISPPTDGFPPPGPAAQGPAIPGFGAPGTAPATPGFGAPGTGPAAQGPAIPGFGAPGTAPDGAIPVPPPPIAPSGPGIPAAPAPGGYGYPGGYGWPGMPMAPQNGMGTAAMVLGILSICLFCIYGVLSVVLGVLAVIFGIKGRRRADRGEATNHGQAQAGLITGVIGIVVGIATIVLLAFFINYAVHHDKPAPDPYYRAAHTSSATVATGR